MEGPVCYTLFQMDVAPTHITLWTITCAFMATLMIVCNGFLIFALKRTKQLHTSTNKLVAMLSLSDITVGVIAFPMLIFLMQTYKDQKDCKLAWSAQYMIVSTGYTSFLILIVVAFDRYLHLTKLNKYNKFMNEKKLMIIATGAVLSAHFFSALMTFVEGSFILQVVLNVTNLIGITGVNVMYAVVIKKIKQSKKNVIRISAVESKNKTKMANLAPVNAAQTGEGSTAMVSIDSLDEKGLPLKGRARSLFRRKSRIYQPENKRQEIAAINTIKLTLITMLCLYNPYNVTSTVITYYRYHLNTDPSELWKVISMWSYLLLFTNGIMNAMIFTYGNRKVRSYTKSLFNENSVQSIAEPTVAVLATAKRNSMFESSKVTKI